MGTPLVVFTNTTFLFPVRNIGVGYVVFTKLIDCVAERKIGTPFVVERNGVAVPCVLNTICAAIYLLLGVA